MFCSFSNLLNRHFIFCVLQFAGSTASSVGLCLSAYGLAKSRNTEWEVDSYMVTTCITVSIICSALKDSLLANSELLKRNDSQKNLQENNILSV